MKLREAETGPGDGLIHPFLAVPNLAGALPPTIIRDIRQLWQLTDTEVHDLCVFYGTDSTRMSLVEQQTFIGRKIGAFEF